MSVDSGEPGTNGVREPRSDESDNGDGGLFGSGSEDDRSDVERPTKRRRKLDDSELDSGDDEGRPDRQREQIEDEEEAPERTAIVTEIAIGRHPGPLPSDGELYLLNFPSNIGISPKAFTLEGFEPPTAEHHSAGPVSSTFSAFATSKNTIRWRKAPSNPSLIQSNARINRWSDGSLTLQLGSNPREQFSLAAKGLAQPQINPSKPTPTSVISHSRNDVAANNSRLDSHLYLASPHELAGLMRNTHHITTALAVQSAEQDDDALIKLQQGLAAAVRGNKATADGGVEVISINEDPENAKRRAELAEKEKARMQRRYQNQQDRDMNRANNVLKRAGLRAGGMSAGLTVSGLEGEDELTGFKARKSKGKTKKAKRRGDEYSDEDDYRGRRRTREDEYDEDDGFLVGSDEEPEVEEGSEEEEDFDAEGEDDVEVTAEVEKAGNGVDDAAGGAGRHKRRRVIEDEEEE